MWSLPFRFCDQNITYIFISHIHSIWPPSLLRFVYPNNVWRRLHIAKLVIMKFASAIFYFLYILIYFINEELNSNFCSDSSIHSFINGCIQPFIGPWPFLQFRNLCYTDGRTHWMGDQPVARPLPTHRTTQTQNKRTHRHPCFEWDSNPRSQHSSKRR
jgi:hypothetical protein